MTPARAPLDFHFDFTSPYSYLLSEKIDGLAARYGRRVRWHPLLLGVIFQEIGTRAPADLPLRSAYMTHDVERSARLLNIPFRWPDRFPIPTQAAARGVLWLEGQDADLARRTAHALFRAYFTENRDISAPDTVIDIATAAGADRASFTAAIASAELKTQLKTACTSALERGVFGAPFVFVDGEAYWGADRLAQIEAQLAAGAR